jgi:hypothetical protein
LVNDNDEKKKSVAKRQRLKFGNEKIGQKTKGGDELPFECNFFKPAVSTTKFLFFLSCL